MKITLKKHYDQYALEQYSFLAPKICIFVPKIILLKLNTSLMQKFAPMTPLGGTALLIPAMIVALKLNWTKASTICWIEFIPCGICWDAVINF